MPRDYWIWWWSGLALFFGTNAALTVGVNASQGTIILASVITIAVWVVLVAVGGQRNKTSPKNFAYWWSLVVVGAYFIVAIWVAVFPDLRGVSTSLSVVWVFIWLIGGLAVIVLWLIAKSRSGAAQSTRPCPYCAEQIQVAAIKCKHCGEMLTSA